MNCNDTMTFLKERQRMCKVYKSCTGCPAYNYSCALESELDSEDDYTRMVAVVQKWSDKHPLETRKEERK